MQGGGMSLNRWAKKRDTSESDVVKTLRKCGFSVERIDTPVDLIVGVPRTRRTYLVEVKTGKRKFNENQRDFSDAWRGSEIVTLRDAQEAMDWAVMVSQEAA
jgi:hypothetical protein